MTRIDLRPLGSVGINDLANYPDRQLSRQPKALPQLGIEESLCINFVSHSLAMD